jgi:small subunit ribosomal protein S1
VVSRRAVVESENTVEREQMLERLQEGAIVTGVVKNLTDYGAFVDLGGVDGLLHITDMAWKRVRHPSEVVNVGEELKVRVLKYDRDRNRVSLGLKQLGEDPWDNIARRYPANARMFGKVSNVTDYGAFVEIEPGVEGLVHVSEMDWTNKNVNPSKVVQLGDEVEVMVLDIDAERRRISLGMKQCVSNPWEAFAAISKKGDKVSGQIKSITDFGIFIGLDGGIDGLVHLSDLSWNTNGEDIVRNFKKGDTLEAVVLAVDPERERISLGVKQMEQDPVGTFAATTTKGAIVKGTVKEVDAKGATIELDGGIEGYIKANDIAKERIDDATQHLKVGDSIEAKYIGMDRKGRVMQLSIRAKDEAEIAETLAEMNRSDGSAGTTKLGALLREQLGNKSE